MYCAVWLLVATLASNANVTPIQKVITLLTGMQEKGKKEKHEEEVQFAAYDQWCQDTTAERQQAIKEGNQRIEKLTADAAKSAADAARLGREIEEHDSQVSGWEQEKKAAREVRDKEHADFIKTEQDYAESISALQRAIEVLKKQNFDRKQAQAALLQIQPLLPANRKAKRVIDAFLAEAGDDDADHLQVQAPDAHAYEFQSQGVVDMLEKLLNKFQEEHDNLNKEEANAKHAFQMLTQDLTGQVAEGNRQRANKSESKAQNLQNEAGAKADLTDTTLTRDDDQEYLETMSATCQKKSEDFKNRQQLRADEIAAIEKAVEILSSDAVSGTGQRHLPQLVQTSLLQLRAYGKRPPPNQLKVANYLKDQGEKFNSRILSALSVRVAEDPFQKVKEMIQDLITRLLEEANAEAEEKGWCDKQLAENQTTRNEKTQQVEKLHAEKDGLTASITKLAQDIAELSTQVSEINQAVAKATDLRHQEKATNQQTIKEARAAQDAVSRALTVLQEFYAKAGTATSFVQQPAVFDTEYKGMQSESGGVVGMLEVIQSDFARLEAETSNAETNAQEEYDAFMETSAVDKAQKVKDEDHKTSKKEHQEAKLQETKADLEGTQKELNAALKVYDSLKPQCIDTGVTYEDRVARRQEEIESLQEALRILNGEDLAALA